MTGISTKHMLEIYGHQLQLWLFIFLFLLLWNAEALIGFAYQKKWKRVLLNAPFIFTNIPGQLLMGVCFALTIDWTSNHSFGFLNQLPMVYHPAAAFVVSFLFLDFGEYVYHVIMHRKRWLWVFHAVHHSDDVVDASTTLREHPAENFIRQLFTLIWVFLSGTALWMLMLRQTVQVVSTLLAHASWRFPERTDRIIGLLFITPTLHHVHHHYKQPYTDSNYGDVLSIWERLFCTFQRMPAEDILFGVDTLQEENTGSFSVLIRMPLSTLSQPAEEKGGNMGADDRIMIRVAEPE